MFCPARSGGQSNMEFSVAEAFGYDGAVGGLIPTADKPGLRLFAIQKNQSDTPLAEAVDLQYPEGWVRSTPATACGAEYKNNGYNPPSNTTAYCGPHCGPSAVVRKTPFGGPFQYKNDQFNKTGSGQTYGDVEKDPFSPGEKFLEGDLGLLLGRLLDYRRSAAARHRPAARPH